MSSGLSLIMGMACRTPVSHRKQRRGPLRAQARETTSEGPEGSCLFSHKTHVLLAFESFMCLFYATNGRRHSTLLPFLLHWPASSFHPFSLHFLSCLSSYSCFSSPYIRSAIPVHYSRTLYKKPAFFRDLTNVVITSPRAVPPNIIVMATHVMMARRRVPLLTVTPSESSLW